MTPPKKVAMDCFTGKFMQRRNNIKYSLSNQQTTFPPLDLSKSPKHTSALPDLCFETPWAWRPWSLCGISGPSSFFAVSSLDLRQNEDSGVFLDGASIRLAAVRPESRRSGDSFPRPLHDEGNTHKTSFSGTTAPLTCCLSYFPRRWPWNLRTSPGFVGGHPLSSWESPVNQDKDKGVSACLCSFYLRHWGRTLPCHHLVLPSPGKESPTWDGRGKSSDKPPTERTEPLILSFSPRGVRCWLWGQPWAATLQGSYRTAPSHGTVPSMGPLLLEEQGTIAPVSPRPYRIAEASESLGDQRWRKTVWVLRTLNSLFSANFPINSLSQVAGQILEPWNEILEYSVPHRDEINRELVQ